MQNVPSQNTPQYVLHLHSTDARHGEWRFVLETEDGDEVLRAGDIEPADRGERVELLAVLRGLEALEGPAKVTVVTPSRYVRRGVRYGLDAWRQNGWNWECFGKMVPVKNRDLWQRLDRARAIHAIDCRPPRTALQPPAPRRDGTVNRKNRVQLRIDPPETAVPAPQRELQLQFA